VQRLHPLSILFGLGALARNVLLPAIVVLLFSRGSHDAPWFRLLLVPALLVGGLTAFVRYWSYRYRLEGGELVIRAGIVFRNERHIPYGRIHNIDLVQNPLHRLLGVAEVRVQTAAGGRPEAVIRVLSLAAVERMRGCVFGPRAADRPEPVVDGVPPVSSSSARPLHTMPLREVVLFGIISNKGLVVVAALAGALWQLDLFDLESWAKSFSRDWQGGIGRWMSWDHPLAVAVAGLGALVAAVVAMRALSVAWAVLKLHGFRLSRRGEDLRAEYGLLTRISKTIPRHRIQVLSIRQGPLHRWCGRAAVQVETAGGSGEGEGESGADRLWLAPLIPTERLAELLGEVLPDAHLDALDWQPISPRARGRLTRVASLGTLAVAAAGVASLGPWGLLPALALAPLVYVHPRRYVEHARYGLSPGAVAYRSGWWVRRTSVARFGKIQALELRESPFDRRQRMATVSVDTAGGDRIGHAVHIAYLECGTARELLERLWREAARAPFRW
jgi:putative membrane protein